MRNKWNSLGVLVILLLLALGYFIPMAILTMEDKSLKKEEKTIAIEEIQLDTPKVDIVEQLQIFPQMMQDCIVVEMDAEKEYYEQSVMQSEKGDSVHNDERNLKACVKEFWQSFLGVEILTFEKFMFRNYVMMAGLQNDAMYSIWECIGVDKEGNEYSFWLDDVTGKVLAFEIPFYCIEYGEEEYYSAMYRLSSYYGFSSYAFTNDVTNFYKIKSWENGFILYDEPKGEKLALNIYKNGDRFYFNIYPGTKNLSVLYK